MDDIDNVGVFLGLDVGKSAHHGHGLTPAGKKVFDKQLPNSEPKLRAVFDKLAAKFGTVLVIVDQPASIGALPLTVARDAGCKVAYLPGLSMRRIADVPDTFSTHLPSPQATARIESSGQVRCGWGFATFTVTMPGVRHVDLRAQRHRAYQLV